MARDEFQVKLSFANALNFIVGEQLDSVEFVQDYVQLRFDGPCLTVYSPMHTIENRGQINKSGQPGYRDALCALIAHKLAGVRFVENESLSLAFEDSSVWTVSLRPEDYAGPEALMYQDSLRDLCFVV